MIRSLLLASVLAALAPAQTPRQVLVVVNDNSPESRNSGEYYAHQRGIPAEQVCRLRAPLEEAVPHVIYDSQIAAPIAAFLRQHNLIEQILFLVTTSGVPLKIHGSDGRDGDQASVDSELTLLYQDLHSGKPHQVKGSIPNPYYSSNERMAHPRYPLYLVTRLAGYTFADVCGLVDRALVARNRGRVILDGRGDGLGDDWLFAAANRLPKDRVVFDDTRAVLHGQRDVIGYASWGSNDHERKERDLGFTWLPGALATEFVSTNGRTFREPPPTWQLGNLWSPPSLLWEDSPQSLSADYVRQGVTGVSGHVYEPYLAFTPRPALLFTGYLLDRVTLAEAFYRAIPALSWQNIVIGDPLCRLE